MHMNVLYQFNEKYAPYAGVSITSLFENNKNADEICVYILGENLSETSKRKFKSLEQEYKRKILFKDTQALVEKMKEWGVPAYRGSYAANMRLFLPMILQEDVDRILYLDADTIVQGSLQPLFEMEDAKAALGMVLDSLGQNHKKTIGLREEDLYYNSGVILFFMSNWKEYRCTERIIEHIEAGNTMYSAPDQDLLNVVCREEILKLPAKYNAQPVHRVYHVNDYFKCYGSRAYYSEEEIEKLKDDTVIYHCFRFLGEFPWDKDNLHPDRKLFDYYLEKSPWEDYIRKKAEVTFPMKVEKLLFKMLPHGMFLRIFHVFHNLYVEGKKEIKA